MASYSDGHNVLTSDWSISPDDNGDDVIGEDDDVIVGDVVPESESEILNPFSREYKSDDEVDNRFKFGVKTDL